MKKLHHILAAIDFTPHCRNALREAARRAALDGSALTAVHVMDDFLVHELKKAMACDQATVRSEWTQKLQKFVDDSDCGAVMAKVEVRIGNAFAEIVEACQVHQADLLVMGSKGSKAEPHRIGVIAARCVRKAPVDVLLVRGDARSPFKRVLACVDFSENSAKAVQCALHLAQEDNAALDCLHVYQSAMAMALDYGGMVPPLPAVGDEESINAWKVELSNFLEPLLRSAGDVPVTQEVQERLNIREAIMEHAAATGADLVVLGTRGKSGLREMLIGTTAEKIVQHAQCSILAVKPDAVVAGAD